MLAMIDSAPSSPLNFEVLKNYLRNRKNIRENIINELANVSTANLVVMYFEYSINEMVG